ncbi:FxLYD domain-containing protein [Streptomyces chrestomyceticus]|uniref:FxLYD domain-containing protein n=1 Tax=Streptomyces chrestomyceticus TaxID=68185 RepID=UPI0033C85C31
MRIRFAAASLIVGAVALTGCMVGTPQYEATPAPASAAPEKAAPEAADPSPSKAVQAGGEAEDDVKVTGCSVDGATGWPAAKLLITNHTEREFSYMIQVEFIDSSGTRIGTGAAAENNLASGQKARATAQGFVKASGSIKCRVTDVQRYSL